MPMPMKGLLSLERDRLHKQLIIQHVLSTSTAPAKVSSKFGIPLVASNADSGQKTSIEIANSLLDKIASKQGLPVTPVAKKKDGQTLGNLFEDLCAEFVNLTFTNLNELRPGEWIVEKVGTRTDSVLGRFEQYSHLSELKRLAKEHDELRNFLGDGYTVSPDIIVARVPVKDTDINKSSQIVDSDSCLKAMLRLENHADVTDPNPLLHASISCKFTMRSDRAQNTRTEALNLLRARKGRAPHIVSVTAEPTASRIASLALGTGDLDCVYHVALYELLETLDELGKDEALDSMQGMVDGKRLKDISDLPMDLAV